MAANFFGNRNTFDLFRGNKYELNDVNISQKVSMYKRAASVHSCSCFMYNNKMSDVNVCLLDT